MDRTKNISIYLGIGFVAVLLVVLFAAGRPSGAPAAPAGANLSQTAATDTAAASERSYDFGNVSMARGEVSYTFPVKNDGTAPLTVTRFYTSCMCTVATLVKGNRRMGPVGMPGHSPVPSWNVTLAPGEEARLEVTFDPAAHGPAGIGAVSREVYLETDRGAPLVFGISANVTP